MERSNGSTCKFKNKKQETEKSKNFPPRGNRLNNFIYYESPYLRLQCPAALVTSSFEDDKYRLKLDGLVATLTAALIRRGENGFKKSRLDSNSRLIRTVFGQPELNSEVLEQLPDFVPDSTHRYYFKLFKKIQHLLDSELSLSRDDLKLVRAIHFFLDGNPPLRHRLINDSITLSPVSNINIPIIKPVDDDASSTVVPGEFIRTIEQDDQSPDDPSGDRITYSEPIQGDDHDDRNFIFRAKQAKYWLARAGSLSRVSRTNLNPIEKQVFLEFIQTEIQNPDAKKSLRAAIVGLVYATGKPVENVIFEPIGIDGLFTLDGEFRCHIPPLPIFYRSTDDDSKIQPVYVSLPEVLRDWFKINRQQLSGNTSIAEAFSLKCKGSKKSIKKDLDSLRDRGRYKINLNRLEAALASEITQRFRDPVLIACLVGDFNQNSPVLTNYRAVSSAEVASAYRQVTAVLFNLPNQSEDGHIGVLPPEKLATFISNIKNGTLAIVKNPSFDIVRKHSAMVFYTWTLLHFATGHRPVRDPFCYLSDINLTRKCALVSDKVVSARYENRTIFLSRIAAEQIDAYLNHLKRLKRSLMLRKDKQSRALGIAINRMVEGEGKQALPFLFLIVNASKPTLSITSENQVEYWREFGELPKNVGRSVMATELIKNGIPAQMVEMHLGHLADITHPFGPRSENIPEISGRVLSSAIDGVMIDLGWEIISTGNTNKVRSNKKVSIPKLNQVVHQQKVFGPEERAQIRQSGSEVRRELVRSVINHFSFKQGDKKIEKHELKLLEEEVREEAKTRRVSDISCIRLLWRLLRRKVRLGLVVEGLRGGHILPEEISPITRKILAQERIYREAKEKFELLLDQQGKYKKRCTEHGRLAEIIISAALIDGIFGAERLELIQHEIGHNIYLIGNCPLFTLDDFTWVPGKTSRALIIGYRKHFEGTNIQSRQVKKHLREILNKLNVSVPKAGVFSALSSLSQAHSTFMLP